MNESNNNPFDASGWVAQAKQLLDDSASSLDAATLSRLNRARQAALAPRAPRLWLLPAGLASACALLLAVAIWRPHHVTPGAADITHVVTTSASAADMPADASDALASDDALEFYQDLDFYAWLDAQGKGKDGEG